MMMVFAQISQLMKESFMSFLFFIILIINVIIVIVAVFRAVLFTARALTYGGFCGGRTGSGDFFWTLPISIGEGTLKFLWKCKKWDKIGRDIG